VIKNEHQYRVTVREIVRFEDALAALESRPEDRRSPPALRKARATALRGQIETLRAEAEEYAHLGSGRR
jgi:hypothetical protein